MKYTIENCITNYINARYLKFLTRLNTCTDFEKLIDLISSFSKKGKLTIDLIVFSIFTSNFYVKQVRLKLE